MTETDIIRALGNSGVPLGGLEIVDQVARDKGYGRIRKFFFLNAGSLYPKLVWLEQAGLISGEFKEGATPRRRYYELSHAGREAYYDLRD